MLDITWRMGMGRRSKLNIKARAIVGGVFAVVTAVGFLAAGWDLTEVGKELCITYVATVFAFLIGIQCKAFD
jgi:hypothetical protein